jgi:deoxyribose-phosphate aldolase
MTDVTISSMDHVIARVRRRLEGVLVRQPTVDLDPEQGGHVYPTPGEVAAMSNRELAHYIDHTLLRPEATQAMIDRLCDEALEYGFAAVCVNPDRVRRCVERLGTSGVKVATTVGFPLGATTTGTKALEAKEAVEAGAREIDMVLNLGRLKDGENSAVLRELEAVVRAAAPMPVKAIVEAGCLTTEELVTACLLAQAADAACVKTGTGMGPVGQSARVEDVQAMRRTVGPWMGVKAAGGIGDAATARAMLAAGASRLGASRSVAIVTEAGRT